MVTKVICHVLRLDLLSITHIGIMWTKKRVEVLTCINTASLQSGITVNYEIVSNWGRPYFKMNQIHVKTNSAQWSPQREEPIMHADFKVLLEQGMLEITASIIQSQGCNVKSLNWKSDMLDDLRTPCIPWVRRSGHNRYYDGLLSEETI